MFFAYKAIGEAIQETVKDIRWIDLDKGQLDNPDQFNSIITPGILIGNSEVDWSPMGSGFSLGEGTITVKLVLRLPADTHLTSPFLLENLNQLELANPVHSAVLTVPGVLSRTKSSDYPSGPFYVVEQTYSVSFEAGPTYVKKQVSISINPFLSKPAQA